MNNINLKQTFITALITIIVTVAGGMLLYFIQSSDAKLEYSFEKILPFEGQTENLIIYHIKISNNGNKIAENVRCQISIKPAQIKNYRLVTNTPLTYKDTLKNDLLEINIETLNPKEYAQISILGSSRTTFPEDPLIKLRAKGVNGQLASVEEEVKPLWILLLISIIAGIASIISLTIDKVFKGRHSDEQNRILAFLAGIHGLTEEVERYLNLPRVSAYWSEMDRLALLGIIKNNKEYAIKIKSIITDLLDYARIIPSSRGIGYYNLAKLDMFLGNENQANIYLKKAKKDIPSLLQKRLKIDPIFSNFNLKD